MSEHNFEGFIAPKKNFFHMPNCWIDICADITNLAEMKIVQYVLRHTWGYHEYGIKKTITTDEFMHGRKRTDGSRMDKGTGLSNRSVIDGLRSAIQHGYLEVDVDETDRARKCKSYALKMVESDVKNLHIQPNHRYEGSSHPSPTIDVKNLHIGYEEPSYQPEESSHRSEKDTIERHLKKDSESIPDTDTPPASATPHGVEAHAPLSHDEQEQTPLIASDGLQEKVVSKSGARKPRTPVDETLKVRVERVYGYFDALAQETSGDATYRYQRTKKATAAITEWLKGTPTEELLREVYLELWKTPVDIRSGFDWKRNMHIHSVLSQYDSRALAIKAKRHAAQPKPATLFTQSAKPVDDDDEPLQYRPFPSQIQKARQQSLAVARRA